MPPPVDVRVTMTLWWIECRLPSPTRIPRPSSWSAVPFASIDPSSWTSSVSVNRSGPELPAGPRDVNAAPG
jgi:hypothetical protein